MPNIDPTPEKPTPRWWAEPITAEQYQEYTPEKFELVDGYLFDGKESPERRLKLLRILLTNCGLEAAAMMCSKEDWREAAEHAFPDFYEDTCDDDVFEGMEGVQIDSWDGEKWVPVERSRSEQRPVDTRAADRIVNFTIHM